MNVQIFGKNHNIDYDFELKGYINYLKDVIENLDKPFI